MERRQLLAVFGAELVLTPGAEGMKGAIRKAEEIGRSDPGALMPQQFNNPANPEIHRRTTAEEIWADTDGEGGFHRGRRRDGRTHHRRRRGHQGDVSPASRPSPSNRQASPFFRADSPGPHKIQGIGAGFVPEVLNRGIIDEIITVPMTMTPEIARRLAREEGILCGISGGAALWAAIEVAKRPENAGKLIVVIIPDTGERYLSTWLFKEA